ncbi:MAG: YeeE/YedE family protein [Mesorhizobium sp.]|nr:MAG: YeeE/YedE family protein [Mesorhizobium sp.]
MDLVPLIDAVGEPGAALAGGALLGMVFGFLAQCSRFCTRSAVLDLTQKRGGAALTTWLAGLAAALLAVQLLIYYGLVEVAETRFFATPQSLSGAAVGGLLFGVGMVLARGCVSRLLVLGASGNLRAVFSIVVIATVGLATYSGFLVPVRNGVSGIVNTADIGGNELLAHLGLSQSAGVFLGGLAFLAALVLAVWTRTPVWRLAGGIGVGATVAAGWFFTYQLSTQAFEPVQAESLSFIRPLATTSSIWFGSEGGLGMDQGLLLGTVVGAFLASVFTRQFRISTFSEPGTPSILRYAAGSTLMGFGGILAVGCTIGAGFTGGSVLAVTSLVAIVSMVVAASIAGRLVDGLRETRKSAPFVPAE